MKKILLIVSVLVIYASTAQVGIGTTSPKANLDISASNIATPVATDGLLIPRVTAFPTPVTAAQNGMLVFLTTPIGINQVGLYFYDFPTTTWKWIASGSNPYVWGNNITNTRIEVPNLSDGITPRPVGNEIVITDSGNFGIGTTTPTEKLEITNGGIRINGNDGIGFDEVPKNGNSTGRDSAKIYRDNDAFGTNQDAIVIEKTDGNDLVPDGGILFSSKGTDNIRVPNMTIKGNGNVGIGTTNPQVKLHLTSGVDGEMYIEGTNKARLLAYSGGGFWIESGTSYSSGSVDDVVFSGMFGWPEWMRIKSTGNVGIGTSAPTQKLDVTGNIKLTGALMPNNLAGTTGDILTSAGAGVSPTWTSKTVNSFITTGLATGIYSVSLSEYTIRVFGAVSEISLPTPVGNLGKSYIIIGSNGISSKIFSTISGVIYDDVTNANITTITSGERYMVQSDGTNWIVIGR